MNPLISGNFECLSAVLKRGNLSVKKRKSTIKVDEIDGMFEKEYET